MNCLLLFPMGLMAFPIICVFAYPLIYILINNLHFVLLVIMVVRFAMTFCKPCKENGKECASSESETKSSIADTSEKVKKCIQMHFGKPMYMFRDMKTGVDIREKAELFTIEIDLPGMKKEEIKIEVKDNEVTISGNRPSMEEEKGERRLSVSFRSFGEFTMTCTLPETADMETIMAKYENGVLSLLIHKKAECISEKKTIQIE